MEDEISNTVGILRSQINQVESQLAALKQQLTQTELSVSSNLTNQRFPASSHPNISLGATPVANSHWKWPLNPEEYNRYGRQMIIPDLGLRGQLRLKNTSILIIGIGGLGCPAAAYLAGAGVGSLGLLDGDTVEISNLHRQILHTSDRIGWFKVDSAVESLKRSNPLVNYRIHPFHIETTNALDIIDQYDLILDCTDRPTSRYLISDAAVISGKPLVSASALRTEGQLLVLNNPPNKFSTQDKGFCYRCVFPRPPPAESVVGCGEGGILGPVVGVMGVLMATEAIKVVLAITNQKDNSANHLNVGAPSLLLYSAYSNPPFRNIRLLGKRPGCPSCSASASITRRTITTGSIDYPSFCGTISPPDLLSANYRISPSSYHKLRLNAKTTHTLIDVREKPQFEICHLEHSINIPFSIIEATTLSTPNSSGSDSNQDATHPEEILYSTLKFSTDPIYFICRHGNDSQLAVQKFKASTHDGRMVRDIIGGLAAWRREVDPEFPEY